MGEVNTFYSPKDGVRGSDLNRIWSLEYGKRKLPEAGMEEMKLTEGEYV